MLILSFVVPDPKQATHGDRMSFSNGSYASVPLRSRGIFASAITERVG